MNKLKMTLKELIELKPSLDNPIELNCGNGVYDKELSCIKVIGLLGDVVNIINAKGKADCYNISHLGMENYLSFIKEEELETLHECINDDGSIGFYFNNGNYPVFSEKRRSGVPRPNGLTRKTGRAITINSNYKIIEVINESK